jgi:unspecific monooxygenase
MQQINDLGIPPWSQRLQWVLNPVGYMENAFKKYPDLFTAKIVGFGDTILFVQHPQALQQILTNDRQQFSAPGKYNKILLPLVGHKSLFCLDGDEHKRERKLLMPSFHGERMHAYGELIGKITEKAFSQFSANEPFIAQVTMQQISLQVILKVVFGLYEGESYEKIAVLLRSILNRFNSPFNSLFLYFPILQKDLGPWSPWGIFLRTRKQLDDLIYQEINECRQNPDPNRIDILSLLIDAKDENGEGMTDEQLGDELMTLLLAGHETTALAMSWALYWIHRYPQVKEKLVQELDDSADFNDPMSIFKLPYLTAVCNETLRIHSVAMLTFPREVVEPVELLGYDLELGTIVMGCLYLTHQREDLYPDAKKFKPERFLERQYSPYEFIPFGGGARRCIGDALAQYEMKLALATILSNYQLTLAHNRVIKPSRRGVVLSPKGGVKMIFQGKRNRKTMKSPELSLIS